VTDSNLIPRCFWILSRPPTQTVASLRSASQSRAHLLPFAPYLYIVYIVDRDFGPFFLKFCTYFPYNAKLCLNGHAEKIDALLRKWLRRLPHPFIRQDRQAGYRYALSILQAEFSLTQILDRPLTGRIFFEEVIRENLDIGTPDRVQLLFNRRITRRTPGRFQTRVLTEGVVPSLHLNYKNSHLKQYHKEGRALVQKPPSTTHATSASASGSRTTEDRLHSQPTSAGRRNSLSRLFDWRRPVCPRGPSRRSRRPAGFGSRFGDARVQALFTVLARRSR
jgi:hypothetical protein